jgi:hypothetical protein
LPFKAALYIFAFLGEQPLAGTLAWAVHINKINENPTMERGAFCGKSCN